MKDTIMEMPDYQRPYEKCLREGEQSLSDRELLAVILRCGVQGSSSLTLADKILNLSKQTGYSGLLGLFHISMQELMKIHGIGPPPPSRPGRTPSTRRKKRSSAVVRQSRTILIRAAPADSP